MYDLSCLGAIYLTLVPMYDIKKNDYFKFNNFYLFTVHVH